MLIIKLHLTCANNGKSYRYLKKIIILLMPNNIQIINFINYKIICICSWFDKFCTNRKLKHLKKNCDYVRFIFNWSINNLRGTLNYIFKNVDIKTNNL